MSNSGNSFILSPVLKYKTSASHGGKWAVIFGEERDLVFHGPMRRLRWLNVKEERQRKDGK